MRLLASLLAIGFIEIHSRMISVQNINPLKYSCRYHGDFILVYTQTALTLAPLHPPRIADTNEHNGCKPV